ncbi:CD276 antigen homolog isoform X2 [Mobula birostris]|uniref:CD276 antigen homolog isoform X2 n=1 Tax=Mobula birostris TaxID=1983395 RepID=UPI003B288342
MFQGQTSTFAIFHCPSDTREGESYRSLCNALPRMKDWLLSLNLLVMCVQAGEPLEVVGMKGERVSLPCMHRDEERTLQKKVVLWQRGAIVVHVQNATGSQFGDQERRYNNRTKVDDQEFSRGNFSLTFGPLQLEDEGGYMCVVLKTSEQWKTLHTAHIQLYVAAHYSTPTIVGPNPERVQTGDLVNLTCHSSGGYPEPTVSWTDGESRSLLDMRQDNFSQDAVSGLWSISSMIQVEVSANSSFTCTVVNTRTNESTTSPAWSGSNTGSSVQQTRRNILLYVTLLVITLALLVALGLVYQRTTRRKEMIVACPEGHQMIPMRKETVLPDYSPC